MPFASGDDVYIISLIDTGEVDKPKPHPEYDVVRDADSSIGNHHHDDLEAMPFTGRSHRSSYYLIARAYYKNGKRTLKVTHYTNTGSRIHTTFR